MNSNTDALISAKVTFKKIETPLKYVLPFSTMDKAPLYTTGHLILPNMQLSVFPVFFF